MWNDLFVLGMPLGERILRGMVIYLFVLFALRVTGKREIGQFSAFDLVVILLISNTVQNGIIAGDNSVTGACIGVVTILALNRLITWLTYHHRRFGRFMEGTPTWLIREGKPIKRTLDHEMITNAELMTSAHKEKIFEVDAIDTAILEMDGTITVVGKDPDPQERHDETTRRLDELRDALDRIEVLLSERDASPSSA